MADLIDMDLPLHEYLAKKCARHIADEVDMQILRHVDYGSWAVLMVVRNRPELEGEVFWREWGRDVAIPENDYPNGRSLAYFTDDYMIWLSARDHHTPSSTFASPPLFRRI